ncbi:MAG: hypothetical protein QOI70_1359 [Microbacteriaceae bacterium]|nr:hypothetical protein [Microbacteriaceae bacterium]
MRLFRLRAGLTLLVVVSVTALSGCAGTTTTGIQTVTAQRLQSEVLTVADSSSTGDFTGALGKLVALQNALGNATSAGTVSASRSAQIQAAIDLVREDLQAKLTPVPTVVPSRAPYPSVAPSAPDGGRTGDTGHGDKGGKGHNG